MPKTVFISRLAVSAWKSTSSPSDCLRPCCTNWYSKAYHDGKTNLEVAPHQPWRTSFRTLESPSSSTRRKIIQDVKIASQELERGRRQLSASSKMNVKPTDVDRLVPRQPATVHRAMIALGSNIGDRISMIEQACEKMPPRGINVKATSLLYETAPMYVTDQASFYNGVCEVRSYGSITQSGC